jgi:hypothetical protein
MFGDKVTDAIKTINEAVESGSIIYLYNEENENKMLKVNNLKFIQALVGKEKEI